MRKFYNVFSNEKLTALQSKLNWTTIWELMVLKDINAIVYYADLAISKSLSYRELHKIIKSNEYEILLESTKDKLVNNEEVEPLDLVPNPIIIKTDGNVNLDNIKEKMLKEYILENIDDFLNE